MPRQYQTAPDVLFQPVADEAVLLNLNDNHYYGLDDIAARMWQLLEEHGDADLLMQQMLDEFDVDEATLRTDLTALLARWEQRGLITPVTP